MLFFGTEMMGEMETLLVCHVHQVWGCMRWQPLHPKIQKGEKIGLVKLRLEIPAFAWCWLIVTSFFRISWLDTWAQVSLMHFLSCFSALLAWELLKIEVLMIELSVRYQFSLGGTQIQMTTTQKKATDIPHLFFCVLAWNHRRSRDSHTMFSSFWWHLRMCFSALGIF